MAPTSRLRALMSDLAGYRWGWLEHVGAQRISRASSILKRVYK